MGDDLADLRVMLQVGLSVAPSQAHAWTRDRVHWRTQRAAAKARRANCATCCSPRRVTPKTCSPTSRTSPACASKGNREAANADRLVNQRGLLFLGVVAAVVRAVGVEAPPEGPRRQRRPARSDYVLTDFEAVVLDKQGRESFTLQAPRLTRSPGDRTMTIGRRCSTSPSRPPKARPHARSRLGSAAKTGWVSADGDELRLRGAVAAKTASGAGARHDGHRAS